MFSVICRTCPANRPNYQGTEYQEASDAVKLADNFQALLKKQNGKWRIVKYALGCTDVALSLALKIVERRKQSFRTFNKNMMD